MKVFVPSRIHPYQISIKASASFRIACSAGVNRSTTIRQYIKTKISDTNFFYLPYGAEYGNYDNNEIICYRSTESDGFTELFGCDKPPSVQAMIFEKLNYPVVKHLEKQILNEIDRSKYKTMLIDYYWNIDTTKKNIFIIVNTNPIVINNVKTILSQINKPIDLVVLDVQDIIYSPSDTKIKSQSKEAYQYFINTISQYFEFI